MKKINLLHFTSNIGVFKQVVLIGFLSLIVGGAINSVNAQEAFRLSLQTPVIFEEVEQGEVAISSIALTNETDNEVVVRPSLKRIESVTESGEVRLSSAKPEFFTWIKFDPEDFTIAPREQVVFPFTIEVPKTARKGGFYGSFSFLTIDSERSGSGNTITNSVEINSVLLFNVSGDYLLSGEITDWEHSDHYFDQHIFRLDVLNSAEEIVRPLGIITIMKMNGEAIDANSLEDHYVLPQNVRKYELEWNPKDTFGKYMAKIELYNENISYDSAVLEFWSFSGWGRVVLFSGSFVSVVVFGLIIISVWKLLRRA